MLIHSCSQRRAVGRCVLLAFALVLLAFHSCLAAIVYVDTSLTSTPADCTSSSSPPPAPRNGTPADSNNSTICGQSVACACTTLEQAVGVAQDGDVVTLLSPSTSAITLTSTIHVSSSIAIQSAQCIAPTQTSPAETAAQLIALWNSSVADDQQQYCNTSARVTISCSSGSSFAAFEVATDKSFALVGIVIRSCFSNTGSAGILMTASALSTQPLATNTTTAVTTQLSSNITTTPPPSSADSSTQPLHINECSSTAEPAPPAPAYTLYPLLFTSHCTFESLSSAISSGAVYVGPLVSGEHMKFMYEPPTVATQTVYVYANLPRPAVVVRASTFLNNWGAIGIAVYSHFSTHVIACEFVNNTDTGNKHAAPVERGGALETGLSYVQGTNFTSFLLVDKSRFDANRMTAIWTHTIASITDSTLQRSKVGVWTTRVYGVVPEWDQAVQVSFIRMTCSDMLNACIRDPASFRLVRCTLVDNSVYALYSNNAFYFRIEACNFQGNNLVHIRMETTSSRGGSESLLLDSQFRNSTVGGVEVWMVQPTVTAGLLVYNTTFEYMQAQDSSLPTLPTERTSASALHTLGVPNVRIDRCYFAHNYGAHGSAIIATNASIVTVSNSIFHHNRAGPHITYTNTSYHGLTQGGALHTSSSLVLSNSSFHRNTAGRGGAIYLADVPHIPYRATIESCHFSLNNAQLGGAIYTRLLRNQLKHITCSLNNALGGLGGCIYLHNPSTDYRMQATFEDWTCTMNLASNGACIWSSYAIHVDLTDSLIQGNIAVPALRSLWSWVQAWFHWPPSSSAVHDDSSQSLDDQHQHQQHRLPIDNTIDQASLGGNTVDLDQALQALRTMMATTPECIDFVQQLQQQLQDSAGDWIASSVLRAFIDAPITSSTFDDADSNTNSSGTDAPCSLSYIINTNQSHTAVESLDSPIGARVAIGVGGGIGMLSVHATIIARNVSLINNYGTLGAGVLSPGTFVGEHVRFYGNQALLVGGAGVVTGGSWRNCRFANNSAHVSVGGALFIALTSEMCDSTFEFNYANHSGGALYLLGPRHQVKHSTFESNRAMYGGAISQGLRSSVALSHCNFTNNRASVGGAVRCYSCSVDHCTFVRNTANSTAGALSGINKATISDSLFVDNIADRNCHLKLHGTGNSPDIAKLWNIADVASLCGAGGAVASPAVTIARSMFERNAAMNGGALFTYNATIERTLFASNSASGAGGAIFYGTPAHTTNLTLTMHSVDLYNNDAMIGGAVSAILGEAMLVASNFINNTAQTCGGAVFSYKQLLHTSNSTFLANQAGNRSLARETDAFIMRFGAAPPSFSFNASMPQPLDAWLPSTFWLQLAQFASRFPLGGGGMFVTDTPSLLITNCSFHANAAWAGLGGAVAVSGVARIDTTSMAHHIAGAGGAVYACPSSHVDFVQCRLSNNSASILGGAVVAQGWNTASFESVGFFNNSALLVGGFQESVSLAASLPLPFHYATCTQQDADTVVVQLATNLMVFHKCEFHVVSATPIGGVLLPLSPTDDPPQFEAATQLNFTVTTCDYCGKRLTTGGYANRFQLKLKPTSVMLPDLSPNCPSQDKAVNLTVVDLENGTYSATTALYTAVSYQVSVLFLYNTTTNDTPMNFAIVPSMYQPTSTQVDLCAAQPHNVQLTRLVVAL
jgi:hypothetical protein